MEGYIRVGVGNVTPWDGAPSATAHSAKAQVGGIRPEYPARDHNRAFPTDDNAAGAQPLAKTHAMRRSCRWLQVRIPNRLAGAGSANRRTPLASTDRDGSAP